MEQTPKLAVVLLSSDLEKLHAGALMGSVAAMSGMTVYVFVSMDALEQFRNDVIADKRFKTGTVGPMLIEKEVPLYYDLIHQGIELGNLHLYACALAMDVMGWKKDELIEDVEEVIGVNQFFGLAEGAQIMTI